MRRITALLLALTLGFALVGCSGEATDEKTDNKEVVEDNKSDTSSETELNTSKSVIDSYGYFDTDDVSQEMFIGSSNLEFLIIENTVEDMGDFYRVKAKFLDGIKVRSDINKGDTVSIITDGITGEETTLECVEVEDTYHLLRDADGIEYYFYATENAEDYTYLYQDSYDRVNKVVYEGYISIKKGVKFDVLVEPDAEYELDYEQLKSGGLIHRLFFDSDGYVVRAMYTSD